MRAGQSPLCVPVAPRGAQSSGNMDAYSSFLAFRARRAHATGKQ